MSQWHREHPELFGTEADPWMQHKSYRRAVGPMLPESSTFPGPMGVGETREDVQAAVSAQVAMLVLTMKPGQVLTVECREDDREMFRVKRQRVES
jgi:hypothetical protein